VESIVRSIEYKGYEIIAKPHLLDAPRRWSLDIDIVRQEADGVLEKHFDAANTFLTEEEAVAHCFEFGRRIIDGGVVDIPTSELP
jgi:hypothetical protein